MPEVWTKDQKKKSRFPWWPFLLGCAVGGIVTACVIVGATVLLAAQNAPAPEMPEVYIPVAPPCPTCDGTGLIATQFDNKGTILWQGSPLVLQRLTVDFQEAVITGEPPRDYDLPEWLFEAARHPSVPQYTDCPDCQP